MKRENKFDLFVHVFNQFYLYPLREEHDKRVAKEIADKLERDLREQKLRELKDSEKVAQQMQVS